MSELSQTRINRADKGVKRFVPIVLQTLLMHLCPAHSPGDQL